MSLPLGATLPQMTAPSLGVKSHYPAIRLHFRPQTSPHSLLQESSLRSQPLLLTSSFLGHSSPLAQSALAPASARAASRTQPCSGRGALVTAMATLPATQKGWSYSEYGQGEVLKFSDDLPVPSLGPDQVLIKVGASGLNPVDFKRRQGKFQATDSPLPTVPGYDVAGTVAGVGSQVTKFKVGDEVYSNISEAALNQPKQWGSLAQYTATEEKLVALKPQGLSLLEAAAVPLAALTAQEAFDLAEFKQGQSVLIINGTGGVGTFAIQLARHVYGAGFIAATASSAKASLVKDLGADLVIDYKTQNYWELDQKFDFVLDALGDGAHAVQALKPTGQALLLTGAVPEGSNASRFVVTSSGPKLAELTPFFEKGSLKAILDPKGPFPFEQATEAFAHLETGRATGKIVVGPIE